MSSSRNESQKTVVFKGCNTSCSRESPFSVVNVKKGTSSQGLSMPVEVERDTSLLVSIEFQAK